MHIWHVMLPFVFDTISASEFNMSFTWNYFCCLHSSVCVCVCVLLLKRFYNSQHMRTWEHFAILSLSVSLVNAAGWYVELVTHYSHQHWHKRAFTQQHTWFEVKHFLVSVEDCSFLRDYRSIMSCTSPWKRSFFFIVLMQQLEKQ